MFLLASLCFYVLVTSPKWPEKSESQPTAEGLGDGTPTCGAVWRGQAPPEASFPDQSAFYLKDLCKLTQRVKGQERTPQK